MALSAAFTVNGIANPDTHAVDYGATVTCALQSITGVNSIVWEILAVSHPGVSAPAITRSGTPNGQTATFNMVSDGGDGQGRSVLVRCTVTDSTGRRARESAIVGVPNLIGQVPICPGEETERSSTHGWALMINEVMSLQPVEQVLEIDDAATDLGLEHFGRFLIFVASTATLTVQDDDVVEFPVGAVINGMYAGSGTLTITNDDANTVTATPTGKTLVVQVGGCFALRKVAADTWIALGALV
jgi:hypothetical protein